jgi:hypothetical protein
VPYVEFAVVELEDVNEEAADTFISFLPSFGVLGLMSSFLAVPIGEYFGAQGDTEPILAVKAEFVLLVFISTAVRTLVNEFFLIVLIMVGAEKVAAFNFSLA